MKIKLFLAMAFLYLVFNLNAQITTNPAKPKSNETFEIIFDAGKGNKALFGMDEQVYYHAGLITSGSQTTSDWKFVSGEWGKADPDFFSGHFVNRGISGQVTPQMLIRFRSDVVDLNPAVVVILAGTNDIAGNKGPSTLNMILDNIKSMTEIAQHNNIKVLLCSVLPAYDYPWRPGKEPNLKIPGLNKMIREYAKEANGCYVDCFTPMATNKNGMKKELTDDGVHPTSAGYNVMKPIIEQAIKEVYKNELE